MKKRKKKIKEKDKKEPKNILGGGGGRIVVLFCFHPCVGDMQMKLNRRGDTLCEAQIFSVTVLSYSCNKGDALVTD
jgi:hypothetical protein